jgi:hypothetical protein
MENYTIQMETLEYVQMETYRIQMENLYNTTGKNGIQIENYSIKLENH